MTGGGSALLAATVGALWALVYLVTQVLTRPALATGWTITVGVVLATLVILGYPSALRGPRQLRRSDSGPSRRGDVGIAMVGQHMPLRRGLTTDAARRTVELLRPILGGDTVAIADLEKVLAFSGPGSDHHGVGTRLQTGATKKALASGRTTVLTRPAQISCPVDACPLRSGVIAPLTIGRRVVGALKVYRLSDGPPPLGLVKGVAGILSLHLELAELDRERQLAADARLDALRAQINPHFLFNTLNTIASRARTDPEEARQLLLRLSDFFRYSIRQHGHFADFGQEYFFVRTYLALEQARYGEDRLRVRYDVDPQVLGVQVPVLTIQPLVENAVKHGLADKVGGGTVTLKARVDPLARTTIIQVRDDGVGMDSGRLEKILSGNGSDGGIGLRNISERMHTLFGDRYLLDVRSRPGDGTAVDLRIPLR
ncbi:MAG: sensor histidine kinase [Nitriliruptorales bacterium]|nr:sensor histidine kinase [Nitriliruptorales bacterium]